MIVFDDVTLRYHYDEFDILKGASFTLVDGVNTVLADAQSGKSSICKLLLKDVAPTSGRICIDGVDICGISNSNLHILYLPRNPLFFERRSVQYNLGYPLSVRKVGKRERRARASVLAAQFDLPLDVKACKLSLQQRRFLAIARGLTVKRQIALFDSFFDGETLDFQYINSVLQHFSAVSSTLVIFTSDPQLAIGHTVVLDGGTTVFEGDAELAKQRVSELYWLSQQ